ncbi:MAG: hypothetical protein H6668_10785 [Ardenticatenaceae bacterium]|nr:hypothetical protein [Ardenticatenaceae bacterium]
MKKLTLLLALLFLFACASGTDEVEQVIEAEEVVPTTEAVPATAVPAIETEKADLSIVVTDGQWLETGISDGYHSAYGVAFSVTNSGQAEAPASQVTYIVHCGGSPTPSSGRYPLPTLAVGDTIHVRVPLDNMCEAGKEIDLTVWLDVKDFIDELDEDNNIMKQSLVMGES